MQLPRHTFITPSRAARAAALLALAGALGFFAWEAFPVFRAPTLTLEEPLRERQVVHEPLLHVRGATQHGVRLTLNTEDVPVGSEGEFAVRMRLSRGLNVLAFIAEGRFGRETRLIREVVFEPLAQP